jgi:hypothetical protein
MSGGRQRPAALATSHFLDWNFEKRPQSGPPESGETACFNGFMPRCDQGVEEQRYAERSDRGQNGIADRAGEVYGEVVSGLRFRWMMS